MAPEALTQDQIDEFHEAFALIDKDSDGFISMEELATIIPFDGHPTKEEVRNMITEVNNTIDFQDFLNIMGQKLKENVVEELKEAFKVFDRNQDGYISANDIRQVMINMGERLTEKEAEQMIREADLDGDGLVSFDDFFRMMSPSF